MRRLKKLKSGSAAERKTPYVYTAQLSFLKTFSTGITTTGSKTQETAASIVDTANDNPEGPYDTQKERIIRKKSKRKNNDADEELAATLKASLESRDKREAAAEADSDRLFLLSLLPDLKKVPEHEKLSTKLELMTVIKKKLEMTSASNLPQQVICQPSFSQWGSQQPFFGHPGPMPAQFPSPQYSCPSTQISDQRPASRTSSSSIETDISVASTQSQLLQLF